MTMSHVVPSRLEYWYPRQVLLTACPEFDFAPYSGPRIALFSRVSEMVARIFANPSDSGGVEKLEFAWFSWLF
jgi:hypothetical protein